MKRPAKIIIPARNNGCIFKGISITPAYTIDWSFFSNDAALNREVRLPVRRRDTPNDFGLTQAANAPVTRKGRQYMLVP
jgi:hypothetical protein